MEIAIVAILSLAFYGLIIYVVCKFIKNIFTIITGLFGLHKQNKDTRLTNLHYFDHSDRYFDFGTNQWHFKQGTAS